MKRTPIGRQVVVVAGAASGIGRETAFEFCRNGAHLAVVDNDAQGLHTLVEDIRLRRPEAQVADFVADVADFAQMQTVANEIVQRFGRIDTWAHVAAVAIYATFMDTEPAEFKRLIEVNLMGPVHGAKAALPHLIASGDGGFICVSSVEAKRAFPYHSAYSAAKHGIDGFLEALRVELRHAGLPVQVTQIMPASIDTPFFEKARSKIGVKPKGLPPLYAPETVARAIVHAAEHPQRDVIVGGAGKAIILAQRLSPAAVDAVVERVGFAAQRTSEPKSAEAPNDLFEPVGQYNRVDGTGELVLQHSAGTWLDQHPVAKALAITGAAAGLGAVMSRRWSGASNHRSSTTPARQSA